MDVSETPRAGSAAVAVEPDPTFGLVPAPTTELLQNRLNGWMQLFRRLINHFECLSAMYKTIEDSNKRFCSEIAAPLRGPMKWDELFSSQESHQDLLGLYQQSSEKMASDARETSLMIDKHVVVPLKTLCADLRRRSSDPDKEWVALDRDLKADRDTFVRLSRDLRLSILNHGGSLHDNEDPKLVERATADPWVAQRALMRHINACASKQDYYRKSLVEQQNAIAEYEKEEVLQGLKVTLAAFFDWRAKDLIGEQDIYEQLKTKLLTLNPTNDWKIFTESHSDHILQSSDYDPLSFKSIPFAGRGDPTTEVARTGTLLKKVAGSGFHFKRSWKEVQVVVTKSGYMHVLSPKKDGLDVSSSDDLEFPETSLYLAECTIAPLMMNEKEPEEFLIQEKSGGMFGGIIKHKFKGKNMDDSAAWWQFLRTTADNGASRRGIASTTPVGGKPESIDGKSDLQQATSTSPFDQKIPSSVAAVPLSTAKDRKPVFSSIPAQKQAGEISPSAFGADIASPTTVSMKASSIAPVGSSTNMGQPSDVAPVSYGLQGEAIDGIDNAQSGILDDPSLSVAERMERALGNAVKTRQEEGSSNVWGNSNAWGDTDDIGGSAWS